MQAIPSSCRTTAVLFLSAISSNAFGITTNMKVQGKERSGSRLRLWAWQESSTPPSVLWLLLDAQQLFPPDMVWQCGRRLSRSARPIDIPRSRHRLSQSTNVMINISLSLSISTGQDCVRSRSHSELRRGSDHCHLRPSTLNMLSVRHARHCMLGRPPMSTVVSCACASCPTQTRFFVGKHTTPCALFANERCRPTQFSETFSQTACGLEYTLPRETKRGSTCPRPPSLRF